MRLLSMAQGSSRMNPLLASLLSSRDFASIKACYGDAFAYQNFIHELEAQTPEPELLLSVLGKS